MKKQILILFYAALSSLSALAQDVIVYASGNEKEVTVKEIGPATITYNNTNNLSGPNYVELISDVIKIKFANGSEEVFSKTPTKHVTSVKGNQPFIYLPPDPRGKDLVVTIQGDSIRCMIDYVLPQNIYYHVQRHGPDKDLRIKTAHVAVYIRGGFLENLTLTPTNKTNN